MLAGCPSTLLSPRHRLSEATLQLQQSQHSVMGTQRFDMACNLPRKEVPRISISLDKPADAARGSCSFRRAPTPATSPTSSSSSLVAAIPAAWEERRREEQVVQVGGFFFDEKPRRSLKRFPDAGDAFDGRTKRIKQGGGGDTAVSLVDQLVVGAAGAGQVWFPHDNIIINDPRTVEQEVDDHDIFAHIIPPYYGHAIGTESSNDKDEEDAAAADADASTSKVRTTTGSGSISSPDSATHCSSSSLNPNDNSSWDTAAGTCHFSYSSASGAAVQAADDDDDDSRSRAEHEGLELVNLLVSCAESITSRNLAFSNYYLARLGELASPEGATPIHRVVAYFTESFGLRVARQWPQAFTISPPRDLLFNSIHDDYNSSSDEAALSLRVLDRVTPIPKFIYFTLNEMLLRAVTGKARIHIVDLDIRQGLQWSGLLQALASRPDPPTHVRITGVGPSRHELQATGARLSALAEASRFPFQFRFHAVAEQRLEDLRLWMLHLHKEDNECVAVNCVLQLHRVSRAALAGVLGLIRSAGPKIVLMAEQEASHDDPRWEVRLATALPRYCAVFDALAACLPTNSAARARVEGVFAGEIRNIMAFEGEERTERHRSFGEWRRVLEGEEGELRCVPVGETETHVGRMVVRMFGSGRYGVEVARDSAGSGRGGASGLTLKWADQPLYTVSAWAPVEEAATTTSAVSR